MCQRCDISEANEECWKLNDTLRVVVFAGDKTLDSISGKSIHIVIV